MTPQASNVARKVLDDATRVFVNDPELVGLVSVVITALRPVSTGRVKTRAAAGQHGLRSARRGHWLECRIGTRLEIGELAHLVHVYPWQRLLQPPLEKLGM